MATLTGDYFEHKTVAGDRWDLIAYRYYGDQDKQTVLLEANRDLYREQLATPPLVFPAGVTLRVPVIAEDAVNTDLLPPLKRAGATYGA